MAGRLLKDRASSATVPEEKRALYRRAAAAYAAAASATDGTYQRINAASLSLLGGDRASSAAQADLVLQTLAANPDEPETPYWRAATQAEALLLLGRHSEARAAFAEAVALAPQAWEDHASTLRQFGLILEAQGKDAAWLEPHRPPRSIHFGGHMSFDARVGRRAHLDDRIAALLEEEKVGFGYGALAAGADILIAEALLARGAELHAILPGGAEAFAALSVDPYGKGWRRRFDALLACAATVRPVRPLGAAPDRAMVALADEVAMGAAAMNARRLESRALQLLVLPEETGPGRSDSANGHAGWAAAGWRQHIVSAPREALPVGEPPRLETAPHARLAILTLALGGAGLPARLAALAARLRSVAAPAVPPYFTGSELVLAFDDAAAGARAALALAEGGDGAPGIGGHYGIADPVEDPFSGTPRLAGDGAALAAAAARSAPPGTVCVTADFAAALAAAFEPVHSELIGELEPAGGAGGGPVDLYALKPRL